MKKKYKMIISIIFALLIFIVLLFYGPFEYFRILWINTAMYTSSHKYLATMLYADDYIEEVLQKSSIYTEERTDDSSIQVLGGDTIVSAEVEGKHYKGYLYKINDPQRLSVVGAEKKQGELLEELVIREQALGGINASGYLSEENRGIATGFCIVRGECTNRCFEHERHTVVGLNGEQKLMVGSFTEEEIMEKEFSWMVEFGPVLIVNGEKVDASEYSGGYAPRTAIGQTENGDILLLVVDGRMVESIGASFFDLQTVLYANGAINAIALDGGSSSSLVYEGELVNEPSQGEENRRLPNAIIFK